MANLINKSDLTSWYTTLNAIRSKHSLGTVTVPTVNVGDKATYSTIYALIEQIEALKSNAYLVYATYSDHSEVASGSKIVSETVTDINADFTSLKEICSNNSTASDTTCSTCSYTGAINSTLNYNNVSGYLTETCVTCATTYNSTNSDFWDSGCGNYSDATTANRTNSTTGDQTCWDYSSNTTNSTQSTYGNTCSTNSTYTNNADKGVAGNTVHTL